MFAVGFAPLANPEAIVNSKLALAFLDAGWEVDVVTRNLSGVCSYDYGSDWVDPWLPLRPITHAPDYSSEGSVKRIIDTVWSGLESGHPVDGCRWAVKALSLALGLHYRNPYDFVISRALPDSSHLPAMIFAEKTGTPWIANWNDPAPGKMPYPYGKGKDTYLGLFYERLLRNVEKKADWYTFPSDRLRNYIGSYLKVDIQKRSHVIPHVALKGTGVGSKGKNGYFTLCHAGSLYNGRDPEPFLVGLRRFLQTTRVQNRIRLVLVGLETAALESLAKELGLDSNINIMGSLGYSETLRCLGNSSVGLIIEGRHKEGIFLPSKFVDYVQAGKPVLAVTPRQSVLTDLISKHGGGIAVDCSSSEEISAALKTLYDSSQNGTLQERYKPDRLYGLFAPEAIVAQYDDIFGRLAKSKTQRKVR